MRQEMHRAPSHASVHGRSGLGGAHDAQVLRVLETLATAVTTGNGDLAAECWAVPALVVGDEHEQAVKTLAEVAEFFAGAREQYNAQGIGDTRPQIQWLEWISPHLALVEVRWPWLDVQGNEAGAETSTYLLKRDDAGELKLRMAIMHGAHARTGNA
ncbi:hypothetical protein [Agrilutibacter solisilvae]|uniref:Uncharacterized protein n=1 Tax=Agrilutibacter solisilvae TaxID=2763317 RepID=A0A974Y0S3_9GAMM|nr:hypothetical protein [Lysobacter solisilvae]QSX78470.1 hypothetical protein I8J32_000440 [Lysobacter solisilvae]